MKKLKLNPKLIALDIALELLNTDGIRRSRQGLLNVPTGKAAAHELRLRFAFMNRLYQVVSSLSLVCLKCFVSFDPNPMLVGGFSRSNPEFRLLN